MTVNIKVFKLNSYTAPITYPEFYPRLLIFLLIFFLSLVPLTSFAEIEKTAQVCGQRMCFYYWPKLPQIKGWHQDISYSRHYSFNAQSPLNKNFKDSETVIYAKAVYKAKTPEINDIEGFIFQDQKDSLTNNPYLKITKQDPLKNKSKLNFSSFFFEPLKEGNWEQVSYSEEVDYDGNEYYIIFVLSSHSEEGYKTHLNTYKKFIEEYK